MGAAIGRRGLLDLAKSHGADQHTVALEQCEIGGDHEFGFAEELSHARSSSSPSNHANTALDSA